LGVIGVPSLLMPLPGAPGDHQTANARLLADVGGAVLLPDAEIDGGRLRTELSLLLGDAGRRRAMALAAAGVGIPDAADRVADLVEEHARG
jgi:UDP-N-acetylglucosamine--N-acetylmuramyl-(pentapeptide) pyrophosphoryl-undecaprenol N-acetylglucosamine transferase